MGARWDHGDAGRRGFRLRCDGALAARAAARGGTPCGNPPAACEIQDTCLNNLCHHAGFAPATTMCRPALDQHMPDATACDGNPCTTADACVAGFCSGAPFTEPAEVDSGLRVDKGLVGATFHWNLAAGATHSDVLRGLTNALPVGPGGGDEACIGSRLADTSLTDRADPPEGLAFWYLVRGGNATEDCRRPNWP